MLGSSKRGPRARCSGGANRPPAPGPPPQLLCACFCPVGVLFHLSLSTTPVLLELVSGSQEPLLPSGPPLRSPLSQNGHLYPSPRFLLGGRGRRRGEVGSGSGRKVWEEGRLRLWPGRDGRLRVGVSPRTTRPPSRAPPHPPACSVTIHNRCKDALANCTKVKQKVSWQGRGGQGDSSEVPFLCTPYPVSSPWGSPHPAPLASGPLLWTHPLAWGAATLVPVTTAPAFSQGASRPAPACACGRDPW